jgi:hypothetical protein
MNMNTQIANLTEAIRSAQSDTTPVADRVPSIQPGQQFGSGCLRADASDYTHTEGDIVNHSSRLLTREVHDAFMAILVDQLYFAPVTQDGFHLKLVNELGSPTTHFHLRNCEHSAHMKSRLHRAQGAFTDHMNYLRVSLMNVLRLSFGDAPRGLQMEYSSAEFMMKNISDETIPHLPEFLRLFVTYVNKALDKGEYDETLVKGLCALPYGESDAVNAPATAPAAVPPPAPPAAPPASVDVPATAPAGRTLAARLTAVEEAYGEKGSGNVLLRVKYLEETLLGGIVTGQTMLARVSELETQVGL